MPQFNTNTLKHQFTQMATASKDAISFIRNHRLLSGIKKHRWILLFVIGVGLLYSITFILEVIDLFSTTDIMPDKAEASLVLDDGKSISEEVKKGSKKALFSGGSSFLLLIILEVVIFYFVTITVSILTNRQIKTTFGGFLKAEWRMIKLMIRNFIKAGLFHLLLSIVLGIIGLDFAVPVIMFFVYAYYIGFAFFDNFIELYSVPRKESKEIILEHWAAASFIGIIVSLMLYIPVIGPATAPVLAGVATAIYCFRNALHKEIEMHLATGTEIV